MVLKRNHAIALKAALLSFEDILLAQTSHEHHVGDACVLKSRKSIMVTMTHLCFVAVGMPVEMVTVQPANIVIVVVMIIY